MNLAESFIWIYIFVGRKLEVEGHLFHENKSFINPLLAEKNWPSVSQNSFPTAVCLFITTLDDQQKKMNMDHISCRQRNTVEKKMRVHFFFGCPESHVDFCTRKTPSFVEFIMWN